MIQRTEGSTWASCVFTEVKPAQMGVDPGRFPTMHPDQMLKPPFYSLILVLVCVGLI